MADEQDREEKAPEKEPIDSPNESTNDDEENTNEPDDEPGPAAAVSQETSSDDEDEESITVSIGDEEPEQRDYNAMPPWVKDLRRAHERAQKKNMRLTRQIEEMQSRQSAGNGHKPDMPDPGPIPTLAGSDYDETKFSQRMQEWHEARLIYDRAQEKKKSEAEAVQQQFNQRLARFNSEKTRLKVSDYEEAEITVSEAMSPTQRGIIISAADNPAILMYALGKNPERLKQLSAISDPIQFSFAAAKLEKELKITKRKPRTAPEKTLESSGNAIGASKSLQRLRDEGDMEKVIAYRRKLRQQERAGQ